MRVICLSLLLVLGFSAAAEQTTVLRCEAMIDVTRGIVLKHQLITVVDRKISAINAYNPSEDDVDAVNLHGMTCLPGLMDMHVHLLSETGPENYANQFRLDPADYAFASVKFAQRTLMAGFTLVRDLGSSDNLAISLRNAIARGDITGPRVVAAGKSLATTGGHADPTNGRNRILRGDPGPAEGVVNGVSDAAKAVRQRYKDGADLIKITATGGVLSQAKSGQNPQFQFDELEAIVKTAKDYGFKVAAHAHGAEGMKRAVRAGVHSIEHGTLMDNETMRLMKKHGTYYVPTIIAGKFVAEKAEIDGYFSELVRPKARAIGPMIQATFARAYKAGVKIAFGTDTGVSPHGDNWKEFVYMVEAGMPEMEAIQAATIIAADLVDSTAVLGSLEPGKLADIIAVWGNPLEDISRMGEVGFVMKDGKIVKHLVAH
ncbi:MAG TPA: amidohydrolase family protein [Gammaproteobacteria bacterium]|nr:amidohydrolase family protein [Gammaproteobacteria bacterium]HIK71164.1 amidohydrolase family protein [Pseudomonadales bacterium]